MKCVEILELLDQLGLGACLLDHTHTLLQINPTGIRTLHLTPDCLGRSLPEWARPLLTPSSKLYAMPAFGEYLLRCPGPVPEDLEPEQQLLVFRRADKDAWYDMLQTILEQIREGIVLCDHEDRILRLNAAAARLDSLDREEVTGRDMETIYVRRTPEEFLMPQVLRSREPICNHRQHYATCHGNVMDTLSNCYPILVRGQLLGAFNVVEDWGALNALQKKVVDLQSELLQIQQEKAPRSPGVLQAKYHFRDILYASEAMRDLILRARQVAHSDSNVMIYGETGTGKELLAQSIHNASRRAGHPFLAVNCAAIPENLLEGILFGTEKGAYTGAEQRPGLFEQANGGTLLLDEINSLDINLQPKLLRVLQGGSVRRVGALTERPVDVRILCNMNIPPQQALAEKKLRPDLFYRLGTVELHIPPLRDRKEDISLLIHTFISCYNQKYHLSVQGVDSYAAQRLEDYAWPGNVRELQHAIEFAMNVIPAEESLITTAYLPDHLCLATLAPEGKAFSPENQPPRRLTKKELRFLEKQRIKEALYQQEGNVSAAARQLGLSRQNLQYRIQKHHIDIDSYREK